MSPARLCEINFAVLFSRKRQIQRKRPHRGERAFINRADDSHTVYRVVEQATVLFRSSHNLKRICPAGYISGVWV